MNFRVIVSIAIAIMLSLFIDSIAFAHSSEPRVEISLERLHPGEVVDVRGVSFGMDDSVTLSLIGSGVDLSLGEVLADAEGEFKYIAVVPTDLAEGPYYFRAVTSHHFVLSSPLTVWGTAITEGGGQGPRDHDDGLLAPMPTFAPAAVTVSAPQEMEVPSAATNSNLIIFSLVSLTVVIIAIGMGIRKRIN